MEDVFYQKLPCDVHKYSEDCLVHTKSVSLQRRIEHWLVKYQLTPHPIPSDTDCHPVDLYLIKRNAMSLSTILNSEENNWGPVI